MPLHPQHASNIYAGRKKVEIRRGKRLLRSGDQLVIYETSPRKLVTGMVTVDAVLYGTSAEIYALTKNEIAITAAEYKGYAGSGIVTAICLKNVIKTIQMPLMRHAPQTLMRL